MLSTMSMTYTALAKITSSIEEILEQPMFQRETYTEEEAENIRDHFTAHTDGTTIYLSQGRVVLDLSMYSCDDEEMHVVTIYIAKPEFADCSLTNFSDHVEGQYDRFTEVAEVFFKHRSNRTHLVARLLEEFELQLM